MSAEESRSLTASEVYKRQALEDLTEEQSKVGSAGLIMSIVGGALMPKLQALIIDLGGSGVDDVRILGVPEINFSYILPLISFAYIGIYCLSLIHFS